MELRCSRWGRSMLRHAAHAGNKELSNREDWHLLSRSSPLIVCDRMSLCFGFLLKAGGGGKKRIEGAGDGRLAFTFCELKVKIDSINVRLDTN